MNSLFYALTAFIFGFIDLVVLNRFIKIQKKCNITFPFQKVLLFNFIYIICEILEGIFVKGNIQTSRFFFYLIVYTILFVNISTMLMWTIFTIHLLVEDDKVKKVLLYIPNIVALLSFILLIINIFTGFMFYVNPNNSTTNTKYILLLESLDKFNLIFNLVGAILSFFIKPLRKRYSVIALIYSLLFIFLGFFKFKLFAYPLYSVMYSVAAFIVYSYIMVFEVDILWDSAQNEKVLESNYSILNTLAGTFDYVCYIEVEKTMVYTIRSSGPFELIFPKNQSPIETKKFNELLRTIIYPDDLGLFESKVYKDNVLEQIKSGNRFFIDFRLTFKHVVEYYRLYFVKDKNNVDNVLLGIRNNEYEHRLMNQVETQKNYISNLEVQKEMAELMSSIDGLTGLLNKLSFIEKVERYIAENTSKNSALIFFDMDHFKSINDVFGHQKGDEALKTMAEKLKKMFRPDELISRMGGDEFCIFLPNINQQLLEKRLSCMNQNLKDIYEDDRAIIKTSVSIGCVFCKNEDLSYVKMHNEADKAMYEVKNNGRDGHIIKKF